jgi:PhnB protein
MTVQLNPYLNFRGEAREALEFYKSIFGGDVDISTYGDMPGAMDGHSIDADSVMHGTLTGDNGIVLMAADAPAEMNAPPSTTALSLSGEQADVLRAYWEGLADGADVTMPLSKAPWGDEFGMLNDKFGIPWMVNITERAR